MTAGVPSKASTPSAAKLKSGTILMERCENRVMHEAA
jgi:hypothetical protein